MSYPIKRFGFLINLKKSSRKNKSNARKSLKIIKEGFITEEFFKEFNNLSCNGLSIKKTIDKNTFDELKIIANKYKYSIPFLMRSD
jgi:hypothetical protein